MNLRLQMCLIVGIIIFTMMLIHFLVKKKLNLKYTLIWLAFDVAMLIAVTFPRIIYWLSDLLGISTPSNFIFTVYGFFVLLIVLTLTGIVSHMSNRIFRLVQTQAILEKRTRELETEIYRLQENSNR